MMLNMSARISKAQNGSLSRDGGTSEGWDDIDRWENDGGRSLDT